MPNETNTVRTTAAVRAPHDTICGDSSGLEYKMEQESSRTERETNRPPSSLPFARIQVITALPDDLIIEVLKWKNLTHREIWHLLEEKQSINKAAVSALKSDTLWMPLFNECFPEKEKPDNECFFDAFKREYQSLMVAVKQNGEELGRALEYASEPLKNDKNVVMAAVIQSGWALEYASERLQNDKEVVDAAVKQCGVALEYASARLQDDAEVVEAAVKQCGEMLEDALTTFRNDNSAAAVIKKSLALDFASEVLKHVSERLQNDLDIVIVAVKQCGKALEYASATLKNDSELQRIARIENNKERARACSDYLESYRQATVMPKERKQRDFSQASPFFGFFDERPRERKIQFAQALPTQNRVPHLSCALM